MSVQNVLSPIRPSAPLQTQPLRAQAPAVPQAPARLPGSSTKTDNLRLGAVAKTAPLALPANMFSDALSVPQPRTDADYDMIFKWVENVTGKPVAVSDPKTREAYIKAIKGKPQEVYDTKNFLNNIGVHGVETYGRDDKGVANLIKTLPDYSPDSPEVSKFVRLGQKAMFWFYKSFPKTFDKIGNLADKYYLTRKDNKEQSWLKVQVPQPGISPSEPILNANTVKQQYAGNVIAKSLQTGRPRTTQELFDNLFKLQPPKEIGMMFEEDFHMGVAKPGEGKQNYGTYSIALRLGFTEEQAKNFATANYDMDLNNTEYGDTDAFPNAMPSKHFNLNKSRPEQGDTRFIWAQRHLDAAVELARRGRFKDAEREVGYGLHGIQDAFAHGHISLSSHAITDNIPDGVEFNPVAAYEATLASIGFLNAYMQRISKL